MELHAEDITALEHRRVRNRVSAGGRGRVNHWRVVTVREVNVGVSRQAAREPGAVADLQAVPAHVRHASVNIEAANHAGEQPQSGLARRFLAGFEQSLKAEADS